MKRIAIPALVILAWAGFFCAEQAVAQQLETDKTAGAAPLAVTLRGPVMLRSALASCEYKQGWITPFLSVDWGDGQAFSQRAASSQQHGMSCTDDATHHIYTVPGTYTLSVRIGHLGPTDAPVTDWAGRTQVTVTDGSVRPSQVPEQTRR